MLSFPLKQKLKDFLSSKEKGMIALTSVLIVSGLVLVLVTSALSRSISYGEAASSQELSSKQLCFAEACAEHALMELKEDKNYSGEETLDITATSSCKVLPVEKDGSERLIKVKAEGFDHIKRIEIEVAQVTPSLEVSSWQEVQSF